VKISLIPHPLLRAFQEILNIQFALEYASINDTERRDLRHRLAELEAQARNN
jgi:hypothetical protein